MSKHYQYGTDLGIKLYATEPIELGKSIVLEVKFDHAGKTVIRNDYKGNPNLILQNGGIFSYVHHNLYLSLPFSFGKFLEVRVTRLIKDKTK
jgi:hypothetical protein